MDIARNIRPKRVTLHWPHFIVLVNNTIIGNGDNLELTFKHALPKEIEMLKPAISLAGGSGRRHQIR